jgi:hypothetical protein
MVISTVLWERRGGEGRGGEGKGKWRVGHGVLAPGDKINTHCH